MKRVYFAGSIRGGREDLALYAALIARLRERSEVLTEFIGESTLEDIEAATMTDFDIYERDMALLHQADAVVAECSTPSLGVGYELGSAHALLQQVLHVVALSQATTPPAPDCGRTPRRGSSARSPGYSYRRQGIPPP